MSVLVNEGLNVEIIDVISNISTKLKTKTFLVGGYVRDLLLGRKSKDIDVLVIGDGISFASEVKKKLGSKANLQIFKNFGVTNKFFINPYIKCRIYLTSGKST